MRFARTNLTLNCLTLVASCMVARGAQASPLLLQYNTVGAVDALHEGAPGSNLGTIDMFAGQLTAGGSFLTEHGTRSALLARFIGTQMDPAFGWLGASTFRCTPNTSDSSPDETVVDIEMDPEGRALVLVEVSRGTSGTSACVARVLSNGALDPSFGASGFAAVGLPEGVRPIGLEIDRSPQGKQEVVLAGTVSIDGQDFFTLARIDRNGLTRPSIASRMLFEPNTSAWIADLTLDSSGRAIVVGSSVAIQKDPNWTIPATVGPSKLAIARFTRTLVFDTTFNGTGKRTIDNDVKARSVVVAGSNILVFGARNFIDADRVYRGMLVGMRFTDDATWNRTREVALGMTLDGAWKATTDESQFVYLAGKLKGPNNHFMGATVKIDFALAVDRSFDGDGIAITDWGTVEDVWHADVAITPLGKRPYVVGGSND